MARRKMLTWLVFDGSGGLVGVTRAPEGMELRADPSVADGRSFALLEDRATIRDLETYGLRYSGPDGPLRYRLEGGSLVEQEDPRVEVA